MSTTTGVEMIEVHLPKLFPTMSEEDTLKVEHWYIAEGETVRPGAFLVIIEAPTGRIAIPTPPTVTTTCRVERLHKRVGEDVRLGELLISLDPQES